MKTISELIIEYTDSLTALRYSPLTVKKTREHLERFCKYIRDICGISGTDRLTAEHMEQWHTHLSSLCNLRGHPLKARTINRHIGSIKGFVSWLADKGYCRQRLLTSLPYLKEPTRLPGNVLTHSQIREFLQKIPKDTPEGFRNRTMFEILYTSGIRAGELLGLDIIDNDISSHTTRVTGKGNKERMVPLGKTALKHLETYVRAVRPFIITDKNEKALFPGKDGKRLSYQAFRRIVVALSKSSGITFTAHTFRRSCATELIRSGANLYHVRELLGHNSLASLQPYVRLTVRDLKKTHKKCHPREKDEE